MTPDAKEMSRFYSIVMNDAQRAAADTILKAFRMTASHILALAPASADRSAAIRYLRLAHMQVNAAICHDWPEDKES